MVSPKRKWLSYPVGRKYRHPGTALQAAIHTQFLSFNWYCVRSPRTCFVPRLQNSNTHSHGWKQSQKFQQDSTFPIIWEYEQVNHWKAHKAWVGQERIKPWIWGDRAESESPARLSTTWMTLASYLHPPCLGFLKCKLGIVICLPHCAVAKDEMSYVKTVWKSTWNRIYRTSNCYH